MNHEQITTDSKDGRHDSDAFKNEVDKDLLKKHPPLDLCYDLAIDSVFYRVNTNSYYNGMSCSLTHNIILLYNNVHC